MYSFYKIIDGYCPFSDAIIYGEDRCLKVFTITSGSDFYDNRNACGNYSGEIISIISAQDLSDLSDVLNTNDQPGTYWTGVLRQGDNLTQYNFNGDNITF